MAVRARLCKVNDVRIRLWLFTTSRNHLHPYPNYHYHPTHHQSPMNLNHCFQSPNCHYHYYRSYPNRPNQNCPRLKMKSRYPSTNRQNLWSTNRYLFRR